MNILVFQEFLKRIKEIAEYLQSCNQEAFKKTGEFLNENITEGEINLAILFNFDFAEEELNSAISDTVLEKTLEEIQTLQGALNSSREIIDVQKSISSTPILKMLLDNNLLRFSVRYVQNYQYKLTAHIDFQERKKLLQELDKGRYFSRLVFLNLI